MYPIEMRVQTIMQKMKSTREQATRYVAQIDDERTKRTQHLYNVDWRDPRRYNVTFNLDTLTPQHATDIILGLAKLPEFTLTDDKVGAFHDFLTKSRVYGLLAASLAGDLGRVTATVQDGSVKLTGMLSLTEQFVDEMVQRIRGLEGVKEVDSQIVVGLLHNDWNV